MTIKRAIRIASAWSQGHVCTLRDGEAEEYHKMALEAFRAMQDAEKNEPLTKTEMERMVGQPVWVMPTNGSPDGDDWDPAWVILKDDHVFIDSKSRESRLYVRYMYDYGKTWVAYSHPPKKEDTNG